jgi:hypothetical protein
MMFPDGAEEVIDAGTKLLNEFGFPPYGKALSCVATQT